MPITPTQVALGAALVLTFAFVRRVEGGGRWRARLSDRLIAGVPWGTLVTVAFVVGFYLFAQSGLAAPDSPVVYAFVSWSYFYPTGILTAGVAHAGPGHLVSNMAGTLLLGPIAEYAWSHYPPARRRAAAVAGSDSVGRSVVTDGGTPAARAGLLARPLVRAVVVFPAALVGLALVTAVFSLGPGLGFSGAVYGIIGFAVVTYPLATVVGVVATSGAGTLFAALTAPVVRETLEAGPPMPPAWAGVGFQAHLLGFLVGVLLAVALLSARGRRPDAERVFFGTLLVGLVQAVWLVTGGGGEEFVMYRGAGVTFLLLLTVAITVAVAGSERPFVPRLLAEREAAEGIPSRSALATTWLFVVALGSALAAGVAVVADEPLFVTLGATALVALLLALPALPTVFPTSDGPLSRRQGAVLSVVALTLAVSLPMVVFGLVVVDDPTTGDAESIEVADYEVAYVDGEPTPQTVVVDLGDELFDGTTSGLVVTSDDREIWTLGERPAVLAHEGNATVVVGGVGWREEVAVDRVGWDVVGNDSAYAVDLAHDGREVRSYTTDPVESAVQVDGYRFGVAPGDEEFRIRASVDGERVDDVPIPEVDAEASLGDVRVRTVERDAAVRLLVVSDGTEVVIAEREERVG